MTHLQVATLVLFVPHAVFAFWGKPEPPPPPPPPLMLDPVAAATGAIALPLIIIVVIGGFALLTGGHGKKA